ncbi:MAG: AAA family ATPase [Methylococcaceae bacterium]|jgi:general secretion pathway protein A
MYTHHFHLSELPFSIAPNPRYLYLSPQHREALAHLLYGIGVGGGFVVLTGEVGTGKTTLCRALLDQLPEDVDIALIFNPRLNSRELLAGICDELNIQYSGPKASLKQLIDALNHHLLDAHARGRRVIVLIDEAQNLRFDVLEQVRLLTNLETNQTKLLQIILVGQPELNQVLERPNLRQLAQRITARYHLNPLSLAETVDYIGHRMAVAGGTEKVFARHAVRVIHRKSRGIPRLINLMADRALLGAYTRNKAHVDGWIARRAAAELMPIAKASGSRGWLLMIGLLAMLGLVYGLRDGALVDRFARVVGRAPAPTAIYTRPLVSALPEQRLPTDPTTKPGEVERPADNFADFMARADNNDLGVLAQVLDLWGHKLPVGEQNPCQWAKGQGLRCMPFEGSWTLLRTLNHPAVLELGLANGETRFIGLRRYSQSRVDLLAEGRSQTFPLQDLLAVWKGTGILIWRPITPYQSAINIGEQSPIVAWVRNILMVPASSPALERVYDDPLRLRLIEFQNAHGLKPDGVIGLHTLLTLEASGREPGIPTLDSAQY